MQTLAIVLTVVSCVARAEIPWQWEAWSEGTQRQLLDWKPAQGHASPPPPPVTPHWVWGPCDKFTHKYNTAEIQQIITDSLNACKRAREQGLPNIAGSGFALVTYMTATWIALANGHHNVVSQSVSQVRSGLALNYPVHESLPKAARGLGDTLQELHAVTGPAEKALTASKVAVDALSQLVIIAFSQGLHEAAANYGRAVQDANNCVSAFSTGHRDAGCPAQVARYAAYSSQGS